MTGQLYATEPIVEASRVAGIGGKVKVSVVRISEGLPTLPGVYHGRLLGVFAGENGEGYYKFEGEEIIMADRTYFIDTKSSGVEPISDMLPSAVIPEAKINKTTFLR